MRLSRRLLAAAVSIILAPAAIADCPGGFSFDPLIMYTTERTPAFAVADVNADGILDVIHGGPGTNVSVRFGLGHDGVGFGTFGSPRTSAAGIAAGFIATGDFNEDDLVDVVAVSDQGVVVALL